MSSLWLLPLYTHQFLQQLLSSRCFGNVGRMRGGMNGALGLSWDVLGEPPWEEAPLSCSLWARLGPGSLVGWGERWAWRKGRAHTWEVRENLMKNFQHFKQNLLFSHASVSPTLPDAPARHFYRLLYVPQSISFHLRTKWEHSSYSKGIFINFWFL